MCAVSACRGHHRAFPIPSPLRPGPSTLLLRPREPLACLTGGGASIVLTPVPLPISLRAPTLVPHPMLIRLVSRPPGPAAVDGPPPDVLPSGWSPSLGIAPCLTLPLSLATLHALGSCGVVSPVVVSSTKKLYVCPPWPGGMGQKPALRLRRFGAGRMTIRTSPSPVRPLWPLGEPLSPPGPTTAVSGGVSCCRCLARLRRRR